MYKRLFLLTLLAVGALAWPAPADNPKPAGKASTDYDLVKNLNLCRSRYQATLEQLRAWYMTNGDLEKARWAEEELRQFHRMPKQAFRLDLDVPAETLQAKENVLEANELYRRAMTYKDKGWGNDYVDNQRRAELLLQQLLSNFPESDKRSDTAFQLGDLYEGRAYKQYPRAAQYFERCVQWNPQTQLDARVRAARLYDNQLMDRTRAAELYREVIQHETDPKRIQEAQKRLAELSSNK